MTQIRGQIDKDFAAAMKLLDQDVPAKVARLNEAANSVTTYCDKVAGERDASLKPPWTASTVYGVSW